MGEKGILVDLHRSFGLLDFATTFVFIFGFALVLGLVLVLILTVAVAVVLFDLVL